VLSVTALGQAGVDLSDRAGHLRAGLGVRADGAALLTLLDQTDRPRVELKRTRRSPEPRPARPGRPARSLLALTAEGATGLTLYDATGAAQRDGHGAAGAPAVWLYDVEGNGRAMLAVTGDGQPTLNLTDAGGKGASGCG